MYSIVIPVYNEEEILADNVVKVHQYLKNLKLKYEIIAVSNGSSDRTDLIGEKLSKEHAWFEFYSLKKKGPGLAFAEGVRKAKGDYIISLDADLSSELTFIDFAVDLLPHADIVVGSKTMGRQRRGIIRILGSQTYILFTQALFDLTISDYSLGAKAYKRELILPFLDNIDSWTGYVFEICAHLQARGVKIIQIGIDCDDNRVSRFNLFHEGFYRYRHLYRTWRKFKNSQDWLLSNDE